MKLRIKGNSVRLRLTRSEVAQLANTGLVEELTNFGSGYLIYAIKTAEQDQLSASFTDGRITIFMPLEFAAAWAGNDIVGLQQDGPGLQILVEKDFTCIDRKEEDQSDQFEHPSTQHHG
jgi:hypothetical protein